MKEKIKSVLTKVKNNKKKVIGITLGVFLTFIFTFTVYNMNNPTSLNRLFASIGSVPNEAFEDSDFYNCVVDEYNNENSTSKAYTDSLTDEELASITEVSCYRKEIENTSGIEKLTGLKKLSLDSNIFQSIDLSNNTLLEELSISNEKVDNKLTEINLDSNNKLKKLDLSYNNLKTLDLSNNTLLEELNVQDNLLTYVNLDNNTMLKNLNLKFNKLTSIDLSNNVALTDLNLEENQLTSIDLSNNLELLVIYLPYNQLTSIQGVEKLVKLKNLDLEGNKIKNLDLRNNTALTFLSLGDNKLTELNLSNNTNITSLYINDTPLIEDILMQNGDVYTIEEKIIPPNGQSFSYSINDTSVASIQGNTITALNEGNTTLKVNFGNISYERKIVVGSLELTAKNDNVIINEDEKYIYFKKYDSCISEEYYIEDEYINLNFGKFVVDDNKIKVVSAGKIYAEYDLVYFDGGVGVSDDYVIISSSTDNPNKYDIEAVNCTYEFINDDKEVIIKYNGNKIDEKKIIYMFFPNYSKLIDSGTTLVNFKDSSDTKNDINLFNNISTISDIVKDKINILNASVKCSDVACHEIIVSDDDNNIQYIKGTININSNNYDLTNKYIYLGTNKFENDIKIIGNNYLDIIENNDFVFLVDEDYQFLKWSLIKVSSDTYDMNGDKIDLKGTELDISKINVTNANLKVDNNKLLVMYNDEVVKEFKLENGKKEDATTKPSSEEKTTTTKVTIKENKTTTTKETTTKKKSIIEKIFGKSETTTKKEETSTTKKSVIVKKDSKTTKVVDSSGTINNNSKNSTNKIVTKSNILILLLGIMDIGLIVYIIINKKNIKL